jgi:hypothetical protein
VFLGGIGEIISANDRIMYAEKHQTGMAGGVEGVILDKVVASALHRDGIISIEKGVILKMKMIPSR